MPILLHLHVTNTNWFVDCVLLFYDLLISSLGSYLNRLKSDSINSPKQLWPHTLHIENGSMFSYIQSLSVFWMFNSYETYKIIAFPVSFDNKIKNLFRKCKLLLLGEYLLLIYNPLSLWRNSFLHTQISKKR